MNDRDQTSAEGTPHDVSLAMWDLASPLAINRPAQMKVGVKCSANCEIAGREIEICDEAGSLVARAKLGQNPWPGTNALYWTEVQWTAPSATGAYTWKVRFAGTDSQSPHQEKTSTFRFIAAPSPEHCVTIQVVAEKMDSAVGDVEIRVGCYRGRTDESGFAKLDVPKGLYDVTVWKEGYESVSRSI